MQSAALPLSLGLLPVRATAQAGGSGRSYGAELPDMLLFYLSKKMNSLAAKWDRERDKIRTRADLEARNRFVREKAIEMIHGLPERNPLNSITVRMLERDGYRVECVMFQSRPDFWVTASLYVPTSGTGPFPGIISPCGHSSTARMYPAYQFMYMNLVKNGFVVLAYDPRASGDSIGTLAPARTRSGVR
jgi:hypothetical protein